MRTSTLAFIWGIRRSRFFIVPFSLSLALLAGMLSGTSGGGGGCPNESQQYSPTYNVQSDYSPGGPTAEDWWVQYFFMKAGIQICTNNATSFSPHYAYVEVFFNSSTGADGVAPYGTAIDCPVIYTYQAPQVYEWQHNSERLTTPAYWTGGGYHSWFGKTVSIYDTWDKTATNGVGLYMGAGPDINWASILPSNGLPIQGGPSTCGGSSFNPYQFYGLACGVGSLAGNDLSCDGELFPVECTYGGLIFSAPPNTASVGWQPIGRPYSGFCPDTQVILN